MSRPDKMMGVFGCQAHGPSRLRRQCEYSPAGPAAATPAAYAMGTWVLDKVIETLQEMVRRSDATSGSRYGRELAEKENCRSLVERYLQLLDETERARRGESVAVESTQKNTPAAESAAQES